ncbi:DNA polymerase III subunit delta [Clostridia bacterium]|nr:DNA polymerase III subunit delta [Clostridia bacterium]
MDVKELNKSIKDGNLSNLYLFYGEEMYLKNMYAARVADAALPDPNSHMMNKETTSATEGFFDKCETYPFMADRRVLIVKNSGAFLGKKDAISEYFKQIPDTTVVIFIEDVDKRCKAYKEIQKYGVCIDFEKPSDNELVKWVCAVAADLGKKIDAETARFFVQTVNNNMDTMYTELNKLIDYADDVIKKDDIAQISTLLLENRVFDLIDALAAKKPHLAVAMYQNLIAAKESPLLILALLERQFRILLAAQNPANLAKLLGLRDFVAKDAISKAKHFDKKKLEEAIAECLKTDAYIKTGKLPESAVETLIIKYAT